MALFQESLERELQLKGCKGAAGISEGKADQNGDRIVYERPACQKASGARRP